MPCMVLVVELDAVHGELDTPTHSQKFNFGPSGKHALAAHTRAACCTVAIAGTLSVPSSRGRLS